MFGLTKIGLLACFFLLQGLSKSKGDWLPVSRMFCNVLFIYDVYRVNELVSNYEPQYGKS